MGRWLKWHCPPDTGFEIRALAVWGRARYLSVTEAPHNTDFYTWMGRNIFCFFQTAETGNWTPNSGVKGSGANHYPRALYKVDGKWTILYYCHGVPLTVLTRYVWYIYESSLDMGILPYQVWPSDYQSVADNWIDKDGYGKHVMYISL